MPISKISVISNEKQYVTFSADQYKDSVVKGILTWGNEPQGHICIGFLDMISQMEHIFEKQGTPVASVNKRSVIDTAVCQTDERPACSCRNGKLATFIIQVQYRQNASWQGRMVDKETKQKYVFRSFRELMNLICELLEDKQGVTPADQKETVPASTYVEQLVGDLKRCLASEDHKNTYLEVTKSYPNSIFCRYVFRGSSMSFGIRLKFKANSSWQGMIYWRQLRREITFRSFLELIMLIDQTARAGLADEEPA